MEILLRIFAALKILFSFLKKGVRFPCVKLVDTAGGRIDRILYGVIKWLILKNQLNQAAAQRRNSARARKLENNEPRLTHCPAGF